MALIYDTLIKTDVIWLGALILCNKVTFTEGNGQFIFSSKNAFILVLTKSFPKKILNLLKKTSNEQTN